MMGAVAALSEVALKTEYLPAILSPYQRETLSALTIGRSGGGDRRLFYQPCFKIQRDDTAAYFLQNNCFELTHPGAKEVFLIGDSHSGVLAFGLRILLDEKKINLFQVSTGYCEPTSNNHSIYACDGINELAASKINELKPDVVIIDSHWLWASQAPYFIGDGNFFTALLAKLKDIQKSGVKTIIVVGQIPTWEPSLPDCLAENFVRDDLPIPQRTFKCVDPASLAMDAKMKALDWPAGVIYLSLRDFLCDGSGCLTAVGPNLESDLTVLDYGHLTTGASSFVARKLIAPALAEFVPLSP